MLNWRWKLKHMLQCLLCSANSNTDSWLSRQSFILFPCLPEKRDETRSEEEEEEKTNKQAFLRPTLEKALKLLSKRATVGRCYRLSPTSALLRNILVKQANNSASARVGSKRPKLLLISHLRNLHSALFCSGSN